MLGKIAAILIVIALVFAAVLPIRLFAGSDICYEGRICRDLGILKGDTGIVDSDYLETRPSRLQAAIMFLRLKGLEREALSYKGSRNFKDANSVAWEEGRNLLSYLKEHPELGWIGDGTNFLPYSLIDSKAYYKVLLEALGYRQKIDGEGDFEWSSVIEFAAEKGLKKVAEERYFTVKCLAIATVEALETKMKGERRKLIEYLVDIGDVDRTDAISAGLYSMSLEAEVKAVRAVSNSKVEVVFEEDFNGSDALDEDLYDIGNLDIKGVALKNSCTVIIDTSAMKENNAYTLVFNDRSYRFTGLKKDNNAPKLIKAECKDTDFVELCFAGVLDNETAQYTGTYSISGAEVLSAWLDATNTKVRLVTEGIQTGRSYELKIRDIKNGDGVKTKLITKRFTGKKDITPPKLNKLTVLNNIRLLLEFSDSNGLNKADAQDKDNYSITYSGGSLDVMSVKVKDRDNDGLWDSAELETEIQEPGKAYTLIIENISDASVLGNRITKAIKKEFRGKQADRTAPTVAHNPRAVTNTMVEIEFKDANALDVQSALDTDNYEIDEDLEIIEIRIKNPNDLYSAKGRTVLLITSEMEKTKSYTLVIKGIADEFGNEMKTSSSSGYKKYRFKGAADDRTPPYITFVECIDSRTIELRFDNALDEESAENIDNYRIDGLLLASRAALQEDEKTVRLTVSSLSSDKRHTILLNGIKDLSGNVLSDVEVNLLYHGNLYDDDPPEIAYIDAVNEKEVWIYFDEEVYAKNAGMKASETRFEQAGSVLDNGRAVVMKALKSMDNREYEVTELTGVWDLRNNRYKHERNIYFYGTDIKNEPPEVDCWDQSDARTFRVVFTEPVLLKGNGVSGIVNPGGVSINWDAVLNPDKEDTDEAYATIDYKASQNIPAGKKFKFDFTVMASDYAGLGVCDEDDKNGASGDTMLESYIEDDDKPYIEYVEAITRNHIKVVFSEAMGLPGSYKITYEDDNYKKKSVNIKLAEVDSKDKTKVNIFTEDQMSDIYIYTLVPQSAAADIAGNRLDTRDLEIEFTGSNIMSSDYIQGVEILDTYTLKVSKNCRIYNVNSLYEIDEEGNAIKDNLIENRLRISENVYKVVSRKPLLKDVWYKITVDGLEYRFYGRAEKEETEPKFSEKEITHFSFIDFDPVVVGRVYEKDNTIKLHVPFGTELSNLKASFTSSPRAVVKVGDLVQRSGKTVNDFTKPLIYTVIAENGSARNYTVTVTISPNCEKRIIEFGFAFPRVLAIIDEDAGKISAAVPYGTNVTKLAAVFKCSENSTVLVSDTVQKSGRSINDFTDPVKYTVVAQDGSIRHYYVTVTAAADDEKKMADFGIRVGNTRVKANIDHKNHEIRVEVPAGTDLTKLIADFIYAGRSVYVGKVRQRSGKTVNDFTGPVSYITYAHNGMPTEYIVTVTILKD